MATFVYDNGHLDFHSLIDLYIVMPDLNAKKDLNAKRRSKYFSTDMIYNTPL